MTTVPTLTGEIVIDPARCEACAAAPCVAACPLDILTRQGGGIGLGFSAEKVRNGFCIECLACEMACQLDGQGGLLLAFPLPEVLS